MTSVLATSRQRLSTYDVAAVGLDLLMDCRVGALPVPAELIPEMDRMLYARVHTGGLHARRECELCAIYRIENDFRPPAARKYCTSGEFQVNCALIFQ